jgi:transposase
MKKNITVATRRKQIFKGKKLTIGMDLGDQSTYYCVLDEAGEVMVEQKLPTTKQAMKHVFGTMPSSRVALETGAHSPWVSRQLTQLGHDVIAEHSRNVRLVGESSRKDDRLDARMLARLARLDPRLLSPVQHRSAEAQVHLTVIRTRAALVGARTALVNSARGLAKSYGKRLRKCGTQQVDKNLAAGVSVELRAALEPLLAEAASLTQRIADYDRRIEQIAKEIHPRWRC